jgi:hypothetical protein
MRGARRNVILRNAAVRAACVRRLSSNVPIRMRSWRSRSRSTSATAMASVRGKRSLSASTAPFSHTMHWPSHATSVVDSPVPAAA